MVLHGLTVLSCEHGQMRLETSLDLGGIYVNTGQWRCSPISPHCFLTLVRSITRIIGSACIIHRVDALRAFGIPASAHPAVAEV